MTDWASRRVLVTGGLGFVGSNLAHRLVDEGATVTLYDARLPHLGANDANVEGIREAVTVVEADVRDVDRIAEAVTAADVVFHCAAQNDRTYARDHAGVDVDVNCRGTVNVLEAAAGADPSPRVVFTSSLAVYGRIDRLPVDEETPRDPIDLYGANKQAAEQYCRIYRRLDDVPTVICRLPNVYGPRAPIDRGFGIQGTFVANAVRDETLTVFEPGSVQRDLLHVEDVVDVLVRLATAEQVVGETYVLGSGEGTTLLELAEAAVAAADAGEVELVPWPEDWREIERGDVYTDPTKLREELGWDPSIDLETGLAETIAFYRANREAYL